MCVNDNLIYKAAPLAGERPRILLLMPTGHYRDTTAYTGRGYGGRKGYENRTYLGDAKAEPLLKTV